jgi:predicted DNA-binding transcriptional regulator AlpA
MANTEEWLNSQGVSKRYGISTSTLAKWRMEKKNLKFSKVGKYVKYKVSDIEAWLEANSVEVG